jgi:hypothetical protein
MDPEVKAAVADAYDVFARYRLEVGRGVDGLGPLEGRLLVTTPLREMPAQLLAVFTDSPHAWNDGQAADDLRALLPRYFELIAEGDFPTRGEKEQTLRRLAEADSSAKWPPQEVAAIDRFFAALFNAAARQKRETDMAVVIGLVRAAGGNAESFPSADATDQGASRKSDSE